jgi:hypothetical protein
MAHGPQKPWNAHSAVASQPRWPRDHLKHDGMHIQTSQWRGQRQERGHRAAPHHPKGAREEGGGLIPHTWDQGHQLSKTLERLQGRHPISPLAFQPTPRPTEGEPTPSGGKPLGAPHDLGLGRTVLSQVPSHSHPCRAAPSQNSCPCPRESGSDSPRGALVFVQARFSRFGGCFFSSSEHYLGFQSRSIVCVRQDSSGDHAACRGGYVARVRRAGVCLSGSPLAAAARGHAGQERADAHAGLCHRRLAAARCAPAVHGRYLAAPFICVRGREADSVQAVITGQILDSSAA